MIRELGQFYTSAHISDLLVKSINQDNPNMILELSVGNGALINAAARRWSSANFITADIDTNPVFINTKNLKHNHKKINALSLDLPSKLGILEGRADVAICNPPYVRPEWKDAYAQILEEAGLSGTIPTIKQASADVLFIAQNLRLLRDNGELGIIVPDGLISGNNYKKVRKNLLENHKVKCVIQLPNNVFQKTEAQTHIILLTKNCGHTERMPLYMANNNGRLSKPLFIEQDEAIERLDYQFHKEIKSRIVTKNLKTLFELNADIRRGNLTWMDSKENNIPCFHTTKFSEIDNKKKFVGVKRFSKKHFNDYLLAEKGDILLARVGRSFENQSAYIAEGKTIITDCVYRIRVAKKYRMKVFKYFLSEDGKRQLNTYSKGVCVKSMSKSALLKIKIPF